MFIADYNLPPRKTSICMASGDIHVDPIWEKVRAIATFHAFTRADNIASGEGYVVETFNCR